MRPLSHNNVFRRLMDNRSCLRPVGWQQSAVWGDQMFPLDLSILLSGD
jgi:hypothetical protein